jgi:hypothetical protein
MLSCPFHDVPLEVINFYVYLFRIELSMLDNLITGQITARRESVSLDWPWSSNRQHNSGSFGVGFSFSLGLSEIGKEPMLLHLFPCRVRNES